jgi:radical SAM superfamily enzyme YgiQ (UPF0313 family)
MAKVVLIDSPAWFLNDPRTYFNLGIIYLAAILRKVGHEVKLMFAHEVTSWDSVNKRMCVHPGNMPQCDFLGVSSTTPQIQWATEMAKAWPARVKILGGSHATYIMNGPYGQYKQPKYFEGFDYLMIGECEETLPRFIVGGPDGIPGVWHVGAERMIPMSTILIPTLPDVTKMPLPAFDMLDGRLPQLTLRHDGNVTGRKTAFLMSSRGCPYDCAFCADARTVIRDHTLEQVEEQFKVLASVGVTAIRFNDDTFNMKKERSKRVADLAAEYGILWRATVRANPNLCTKELFDHFREKGCRELQFGVEHASESVLRMMTKRTTPQDNEYAIKQAQDCGMAAHAFLIIGFPGETLQSIDEMREWVLRVRPNSVAVHMFQPLPGSEVWNHPEHFGVKLKEAKLHFENMWEFFLDDDELELSLELSTISQKELLKAHRELATLFRTICRD